MWREGPDALVSTMMTLVGPCCLPLITIYTLCLGAVMKCGRYWTKDNDKAEKKQMRW